MLMFADKVGGWGWTNDDVSKKKISKGKNFSLQAREKSKLIFGIFFQTFLCSTFFVSTFFCVIFRVIHIKLPLII